MAEKFSFQSGYLYAYNNPVRFTDFMGMNAQDNVEDEKDTAEEKAAKAAKKTEEDAKAKAEAAEKAAREAAKEAKKKADANKKKEWYKAFKGYEYPIWLMDALHLAKLDEGLFPHSGHFYFGIQTATTIQKIYNTSELERKSPEFIIKNTKEVIINTVGAFGGPPGFIGATIATVYQKTGMMDALGKAFQHHMEMYRETGYVAPAWRR